MSTSASQFGQLKLIGRLSLWFAAVAFMGLVGVLVLARPVSGNYLETIRTMSVTRQQLPALMLVGGLVLAIATALSTWLIALYSSFRVAGPLYRFCIDLERGIREGQVPQVRVRDTDEAQEDARYLEETVRMLYRHYDELGAALSAASAQLGQAPPDRAPRRCAGEQVHALIERVRL